MAQLAKEINEMHEQTVLAKCEREYVHSELDSTQGMKLLKDFNIKVTPVPTVPFDTGKGAVVPGFTWDMDVNEDNQEPRYTTYVENNIANVLKEKRLCVYDVAREEDVLSIRTSDIVLCGRTDLVILSDIAKDHYFSFLCLPEVKMVIEVMKKVENHSDFQALSELIALDLIVSDVVMTLLTASGISSGSLRRKATLPTSTKRV